MEKELQKIKQALQDSELRFRRLFEAAQDGILILNADTGQIDEVNPYLIKILGYSHEEFLKKKLWEVGAFIDIAKSKEAFEVTQKSGYVTYEDMPLQTKDGRLIKVEFVSNLYKVGPHKVIQCNIRDITDRKNLELLEDAKKLLDEEKKKIEFIAEISHEFRTPLAIIKGNVDLALMEARKKTDKKTDAEVRKSTNESLHNIDEEIKYLSALIADLTLLTITDSGIQNIVINNKVNITKLIDKTIKRWKIVSLKKNISIRTKLTNVTIMGDEKYLERLLINLIKNAILYGKKGGYILISVSKKKNEVEISVKDNGIGMNALELPNIFNRFYRADNSHKSDNKSVGLGLAISKWIVETHDGKILATSPGLGKGSTFTVTLPIKK
ncbi:MAG: PAS domain-containing sensor histidine kinase [bacterium]|nr:PAS domain-containing sensor histidine kinase [bacterium]